MSGITLLWDTNRVHLKTRITVTLTQDTLIIKNSEIISWYYTSRSGQVRKHKPESILISKIVSKFSSSPSPDQIIAICRDFKETSPKLLLASHFDLLIFQICQKALTEDIILQVFAPGSEFTLFEATFVFPKFEFRSVQLSSRYLINGKYKNEDLMTEEIKSPTSELLEISEGVVGYLSKKHGSILSCSLEFLKDECGYYLIDIVKVTEGVVLAGTKITRCVSNSTSVAKPLSRPITARSVNKSVFFTQIDTTVSFNKVTTPKCFKLSYEFPNKSTQTQPVPCCDFKLNVQSLQESIQKALQKNSELADELDKLRETNAEDLKLTETKWKKKCLELSRYLAERKIDSFRLRNKSNKCN